VASGIVRWINDVLIEHDVLGRSVGAAARWRNFTGHHEFVDRSRGSDRLAYVLVGYKPHLWSLSLDRLSRFVSTDMDVCLVTPAVRNPALDALAKRNGWSTLWTRANYLSLAQNLAIRGHPAARFIFKFDEDIFIGRGYCEDLLSAYERIGAEGSFRPGAVAPVLNVNGYSYVEFLRTRGLQDAWRERFGPLLRGAGQIPATDDGAAARWLWENSLPFDELCELFRHQPFAYSAVPHKFNIGAILFERDFWERIGGFLVRPPQGALGVDETHLCTACVQLSRPVLVAHNVLAGHFAFAGQDAAMRDALSTLARQLRAG